jgi:uncharacterized protein YtpQ (UPF0354 family)
VGFWKRLGAAFGLTSADGATENVEASSAASVPRAAMKQLTQQEAFARLFMAEAAKLETVQRVEQDAGEPFCIRIWLEGADEPMTAYLYGIFQETREFAPEQRLAQIGRFLKIFEESREELTWDDARERLIPVVRVVDFAIDSPFKLVSRPFLPFLRLFVAIDHEDSLAFVSDNNLQEWQKDASEVFEHAFQTLANHVSEADVEPYDSDANSPLLHVAANDSYEPSRLAAPGFLASFAGKVPGNPIAVIPDRSRMLISGDGDRQTLARLARSAEAEFMAAARAISPAVYTVAADGAVQPLHLASDHPEHFLIERGHRMLAASSYSEQQQRLEKEFERDAIDIFVASLGLFADKVTGETKSWAAMPEGVDGLLPEVDLIAIGGGEGTQKWHAMVPWQALFDLAPECLELSPDHDPPRWRTVAWPNDVAIAKLRALAEAAKRPHPG